MLRILCSLLGVALAWPAAAVVYQCVDADGRLLLTDSPCPAGYQSNLVVNEPPSHTPSADEAARRHAEAARDSAQAQAADLRRQLEDRQAREQTQSERLQALDDKLDAVLERQVPDSALTVIGPPVWSTHRPLPPCGDNVKGTKTRPWADCRPQAVRPAPGKAKPENKAAKRPERDFRRQCGTFGCTPTITHAPGDEARRARVP